MSVPIVPIASHKKHIAMDAISEINTKTFVRSILGKRVICTLSDGKKASGQLICVDRLKNLILSDCVCEQQICSTDYAPPTASDNDRIDQHPAAVYQIATRHLQQAMIPGKHIKSIMLCDRVAYESAIEAAKIINDSAR